MHQELEQVIVLGIHPAAASSSRCPAKSARARAVGACASSSCVYTGRYSLAYDACVRENVYIVGDKNNIRTFGA